MHIHVRLYIIIRVCLQDFHEMVVPPCRNMKPILRFTIVGITKIFSIGIANETQILIFRIEKNQILYTLEIS
jgi:hypothetical protein